VRIGVTDVAFSYESGGQILYSGLSVEIRAGQMMAVQGPSGSGKSTLLDLLGMLRLPTSGAVRIYEDEKLVAECTDNKRALPPDPLFAWILQNNAVLAGRSALDNTALAALVNGAPRSVARKMALAELDRFDLGHRTSSKVEQLSGGEIQRVTIARSMLSPATILLADEPTGQLDASNTRSVVQALRRAAEAGKIVVVATHDPIVVDACDSAIDLGGLRT